MSVLIYFFVLLVSAASVLFGLDLMTSPLPKTPNVPIGRSVQTVSKPATSASGPQQEAQVQARILAQNTKANERALTPVYPTSPGMTNEQAETSGSAPQAPVSVEPGADGNRATASEAKAPPPPPAPPKVQPVAQQAPKNCNVQACAGAYHSFRASDCTYQPYEGSRQLCTKADGTTTATAAAEPAKEPKQQQAARKPAAKDELTEVERSVRRQPLSLRPSARQFGDDRQEMSETERIVRQMTPDDGRDIAVQGPDGRIIIVRKSYR